MQRRLAAFLANRFLARLLAFSVNKESRAVIYPMFHSDKEQNEHGGRKALVSLFSFLWLSKQRET